MKAIIRLRNSSNRMKRMIDALLDFSRTRLGGQLPLSLEEVDLAEACGEIINELRTYHSTRDLRLDVSGDMIGIWDRGRIEEVLANLIGNALAYGSADKPVTLTAFAEEEEVVLAVHNAGAPIPGEMQQVIFDPLARGKMQARPRRNSQGGLGLGLYIANKIVEAHGGKMELSSGEETGTTFTVRLPRRPPHEVRENT